MVTHAYARRHGLLMDYLVIGSLPPTGLTPEEQKEWAELQADPAKLRQRRKLARAKIAASKAKRAMNAAKTYCASQAVQSALDFLPSPRTKKQQALAAQIVSLQAKLRLAIQAVDWLEAGYLGGCLDQEVAEYTKYIAGLEKRNVHRLAVSSQITERYKTLKAAYADGWKDLKPCEYGGEQIALKGHTLVKNPKRARSKKEWGYEGYEVKPDEKPHARFSWWGVYREDQVRRVNWQSLDILSKMAEEEQPPGDSSHPAIPAPS